jgi:hypothetical protein
MTPDERLEAHEQWLLDHDRGLTEIRTILTDVADLQRKQSAILLELTQRIVDVLDRTTGPPE